MQDCVQADGTVLAERLDSRLVRLVENLRGTICHEGNHVRLALALQPLEFDAEFAASAADFRGRHWFVDDFNAWYQNPDSSKLRWITAGPGIGKTALACWLCQNNGGVVAFHVATHESHNKCDARRAVLTLAHQLSTQFPSIAASLVQPDLERFIGIASVEELWLRLVEKPLLGLPASQAPFVIVLDGVEQMHDERGRQNKLATVIAHRMRHLPPFVHIMMFTRPDDPYLEAALSFVACESLEGTRKRELHQDVVTLLNTEIRESDAVEGSDEDLNRATEVVAERANGMLLYALNTARLLQAKKLVSTGIYPDCRPC